jgi:protease IV
MRLTLEGSMKRLVLIGLLFILAMSCATAQTFPSYYSASDLSFASPGAMKFGLYGYDNPALLTYVRHPDFQFTWTDVGGKWNDFNRWGLFAASQNAAFGVVKTKTPEASLTDYKFSLGFGDKTVSMGMAFSFAAGNRDAFDRGNSWTFASLVRPDPHVSVGVIGTAATSGGRNEVALDLGLRPLGNELVTLFGDYAIQNRQTMRDAGWSYGAAVEPVSGIRLIGRVFNTHAYSLGVSFSLGNSGLSAQTTMDDGGKRMYNTYSIRAGAFDRTVITKLQKDSRSVELNMGGRMKYQRFLLFDNSNTLKSMIAAIDAAKNDETVGAIAINTSGMEINREMLWELRERLRDFRSTGKKVVIFIDRAGMEEYRFATIADKIVLDPTGIIMMPGYAWGSTYLKGMLDKIGIGFDEWRFFRYKSAFEYFSRDSMSAGDREQKQKYIDDIYAGTKADISEGRKQLAGRYDQIINDDILFLAKDALEKGLVDTLGRWDERQKIVASLTGGAKSMVGPGILADFNMPYDNVWGERPTIAVIYALGVCAMDEGIRARSLIHNVEAAMNDKRVKAIVLRVDSPGGDGTASDYIAEALKRAKRVKPVIVSQGWVAGSGGYWLSMYADTIIAAPNTITGSIGVIGGWLYNKEFKEKLGITTDHVQAGKHADFDLGARLPLIGVGIPDRTLNTEERAKIEKAIRTSYADFVGKVAEGRRTTPEKIEEVAQGRFFSGTTGKEVGLVDVLGGLHDAIRIAKLKAGIAADQDVNLTEQPKPGLIDFSQFVPMPFGVTNAIVTDPAIEHLKFRLNHNGEPLPVMMLDDIELEAPTE